jgi:ParB/RepB/Spo0J family partition protein
MPTPRMVAWVLLVEPPEPLRVAMSDEDMERLVASIRRRGIIQPLAVLALYQNDAGDYQYTPDPALGKVGAEPMRYEIVDGHRRWYAAREVGLAEVPVVVFENAEAAKFEIMLDANMCREDVTPYEEGVQFYDLAIAHSWSMDQLMEHFGKSEDYINDRVAIVKEDPAVAAACRDRKINLGQAKELLKCKDPAARAGLLDQAVVHGATIAALRVMRHNVEDDLRRAQGQLPINASPQFVPGKLMDPDLCLWCGREIELGNRAMVPIHTYHQLDLQTLVDKFGLKRITGQGGDNS